MSIPRITSRTPLRDSESSLPLPSPSPLSVSSASTLLSFMALKNPRKPRNRTSLIVFLSLIFISSYIFFVQRPSLSSSSNTEHEPTPLAQALRLAELRNKNGKPYPYSYKSNQPQIQLNPEQELAAVSSFLASLKSNVIPPTVDPSHPIDPQLVLEFDTRSPRASEEVEVMVEDVWSRNPVFLYSKLYSPISREIKATLSSMNLYPPPTIMDVDIRDDSEVLKPILLRLTSSSDLPILLIGGKPVGGITDIREMTESGELKSRIYAAGAVSVEKKKKHRK